MVSLLNDDLSNGNSKKRPLENGHCSSSGVLLKYKPRRVSAIRDFPLGCGQNAPRINLNPQETALQLVVSNKTVDGVETGNLKTSEIGVESVSHEALKSPVRLEMEDSLDDLVGRVMASTVMINGVEKLSTDVDPLAIELPNGLVDNALELSKESHEVEVRALVKEELHEGEVRASVKGSIGEEVQAMVKNVGAPDSYAIILEGTRPKNNYCQRTVSATRDFPPFCGRNAPRPTEEDYLRIISGNKSLGLAEKDAVGSRVIRETLRAVVEDVKSRGTVNREELEGNVRGGNVQKSELREIVPKPMNKSHTVTQGGNEDAGGPLSNGGKDPVVYSLEKSLQKRPSGGLGRELDRVIVQALMAKPNCPWRQGKGDLTSPDYVTSSCKVMKHDFTGQEKSKLGTRRNNYEENHSGGKFMQEKTIPAGKAAYGGIGNLVVKDEEDYTECSEEKNEGSLAGQRPCDFDVSVPSFGLNSSIHGDAHNRVKEAQTSRGKVRASGEELEGNAWEGNVREGNVQKSKLKEIVSESRYKLHTVAQKGNEDVSGPVRKVGKELVVYSPEKSLNKKPSGDAVGLGLESDRVIVQALMAAPNCPWRQGKGALTSPDDVMSRSKAKKLDFSGQDKSELGTRRKNYEPNHSGGTSVKGKSISAGKATYGGIDRVVVMEEEDYAAYNEEKNEVSPAGQIPCDFNVSLPPFGPNSSTHGDARNRVREALRLFQAIFRKLLQGEEAKSRQQEKGLKRIDLVAAKIVKEKGKEVNPGEKILGAVPGVEVGDEFQYRVELAIVGIHRLNQGGIDYMKIGKENVAASIVASGGYADELDNADVLIYSGQGGLTGGDKQPEDQKLVRGNLALKNSITAKNPVRVIRGSKETKAAEASDARGKVVATYVYDGLYMVERYWQEVGPHGKLVFKFELRRISGQPELAWKEVKKSERCKTREGLCVVDISGGKEKFPICAVNTIDNEKPLSFNYISRMIYPDGYLPVPPKGCDCTGGCLDSTRCPCTVKNDGEIPYNYNGAIVEAKPMVYECGPSCMCPPSCYNRVSQHGLKIQLEIFKTESRGWGVRSLNSIPSGSFICEYMGELLEDKEAEQRTGNDEYLFDIGQNYNDCSLKPDAHSNTSEVVEDDGFTIDAAQYGNVGRFINHSCSPNLYAQNVLYDHEDKRMSHIMFFAAENIPPLKELTYHYNYSVDQIHDSDGNIKKKSCYCGSAECTGRMY